MKINRKKIVKRVVWSFLISFVLMNLLAYFHAYKFTHFEQHTTEKSELKKISVSEKIKILFLGINNPKPINKRNPSQKFENIILQSNKKIACWYIKTEYSKGTVILFHGYAGEKSQMLDKSDEFLKQGYDTFLVDFMGCGSSEGNQTTIGFQEAKQVKTAFEYVVKSNKKQVYLFGTSLGAVAILKAINDYKLNPAGIMLECPFGSMYKTVCARFDLMKIPSFPMANLLTFWGGFQNDFWAFGHNPTEYAKNIKCPTLLLYGEQDQKVSLQEIQEIYFNLGGEKKLKIYEQAGHENYLLQYKKEWLEDIRDFMN